MAQSKHTILRAYVIVGGTPAQRNYKLSRLINEDSWPMYQTYQTEDALAVVFSNNRADFKNMNFELAKKLVGRAVLDAQFKVSAFGLECEARFGTIDLSITKAAAPTESPWHALKELAGCWYKHAN